MTPFLGDLLLPSRLTIYVGVNSRCLMQRSPICNVRINWEGVGLIAISDNTIDCPRVPVVAELGSKQFFDGYEFLLLFLDPQE